MKIEAAENDGRLFQCRKPKCLHTLTHRHHKGCETMWLKAFKRRKKQQRYKSLARRYLAFRSKDTVELCEGHHEAIHLRINTLIAVWVRKMGHRPTSAWTWAEADALMKYLRNDCDAWLKLKTPVAPLVKFAHPPSHMRRA